MSHLLTTSFPSKQKQQESSYVTVLAIYDSKTSPANISSSPSLPNIKVIRNDDYEHTSTSTKSGTSPTVIPIVPAGFDEEVNTETRLDKKFVNVASVKDPPISGLHVLSNYSNGGSKNNKDQLSLENKLSTSLRENSPSTLRSALKKDSSFDRSSESAKGDRQYTRSVSIEPVSSAERLEKEAASYKFSRNDARKSRISEAFLDAKDRIDSAIEDVDRYSEGFSPATHRFHRILISADSVDLPIGITISAIPDSEKANRLLAVEVIRIEENSRVSNDGRMRIGDQIVEINGLPCSQISFARARLHLRELAKIAEPTIAFQRQRQIQPLQNSLVQQPNSSSSLIGKESGALANKPVVTALQQGNTSAIGRTKCVTIKKAETGFGFAFAGRVNAQGEHMYYAKSVKDGGPSSENLAIGDRLLLIDGADLANLQQSEVTSLLKSRAVGETIELVISRGVETEDGSGECNKTASERPKNEQKNEIDPDHSNSNESELLEHQLQEQLDDPNFQCLRLDIKLNDSPSAGLGISLKAQRKFLNGRSTDSGLYIQSIFHGSAAYKDGRLKIDDRLVGIENTSILLFNLNSEALGAFLRSLSALPSSATSVCLFVARCLNDPPNKPTEFVINRPIFRNEAPELEPTNNYCNNILGSRQYGSDSDISQVSSAVDPKMFVRDMAIRKSINEKRPLGMQNDPFHMQTYQRIVHRRQTSAPSLTIKNAKLALEAHRKAPPHRRSFNDGGGGPILLAAKNSLPKEEENNEANGRLGGALLKLSHSTKSAKKGRPRPVTVYGDNMLSNSSKRDSSDLVVQYQMQTLPKPVLVSNDNDDETPETITQTSTVLSPKLIRKFCASSFKNKRTKISQFFNGIARSASTRKPNKAESFPQQQNSSDSDYQQEEDVVAFRVDKENQQFATNYTEDSSPKRRAKSLALAPPAAENICYNDGLSLQSIPKESVGPPRKVSTSISQQTFSMEDPNDNNFVPKKSSEKHKSFGNGLLKFFKGTSAAHQKDHPPQQQGQRWGRSPTSEFYVIPADEMAAAAQQLQHFGRGNWPPSPGPAGWNPPPPRFPAASWAQHPHHHQHPNPMMFYYPPPPPNASEHHHHAHQKQQQFEGGGPPRPPPPYYYYQQQPYERGGVPTQYRQQQQHHYPPPMANSQHPQDMYYHQRGYSAAAYEPPPHFSQWPPNRKIRCSAPESTSTTKARTRTTVIPIENEDGDPLLYHPNHLFLYPSPAAAEFTAGETEWRPILKKGPTKTEQQRERFPPPSIHQVGCSIDHSLQKQQNDQFSSLGRRRNKLLEDNNLITKTHNMRIHQPTAVGADDGDSRFTAVAVEHFHEPPIEEKMARGTCPPMMATTIMTSSTNGSRKPTCQNLATVAVKTQQQKMRGTPATEEIPRRYHHRPPQMMQQTQPLVNPQSQQKMVVPSQTAQSLIRGQQQQQQFDSSNSSSNGGGGSDDTISYFAPSAVPQRDINSGNNDNQTDGRKTTGGVGPRRQKQRQKLLRRSVPSAVFYDDGESPVRC